MSASAIIAAFSNIVVERGHMTPDEVVAMAKDKNSPIHDWFEWDNKAAGHAHRLYQARRLLGMVRLDISTTEHTISVPAFVRDTRVGNAQGYVSVKVVRDDADYAREIVVAEFARAAAALDRARRVAAALNLENEIVDLGLRIESLSERARSVGLSAAA